MINFTASSMEQRTQTHLDTVGVEWRAEEHVEKEQLCSDVDEIEKLDKHVDDDKVVTMTTARPAVPD